MPTSFASSSGRRDFLRCLVVGSTASMVVRRPWAATVLASVETRTPFDEVAVLRLRPADFPPLLEGDFGSVRIGFTALGQVGPSSPLIVSRDGSEYFAVGSECTHEGCILPAFGASKVSICPCHGSGFRPNGALVQGPARFPLATYRVGVEGEGTLRIELPDFPPYRVTVRAVTGPADDRLAIGFLGLRNVEYEVVTRTEAGGSWQVERFARTETGPIDEAIFRGTGVPSTVYVARGGGSRWVAVGARVKEV